MDAAERSRLNTAMGRLARGDRAAFAVVFEALAPPVRRLCAKKLDNAADADDAAQAALIKLFERAPDYDPARDVVGWALSLAWWECRTVISARQRARSKAGGGVDADDLPAAHDLEARLLAHEADELLRAAIGELSPADTDALKRALQGAPLSAGERKRKQRALARLRALFLRTAPPAERAPPR